MKSVQKKSLNNGGGRAPTRYLLSSNEASGTANVLHIIELLAKDIPQETLKYLGYCKQYRLFSTN